MILTCPKCATRYLVDDSEMRAGGRKVRCSACGAEWRIDPEATVAEPAPMSPADNSLETDAPAPGEIELDPHADAESAAASVVESEPLSLPPRDVAPPASEASIVAPIGGRARTVAKPAPRSGFGAGWALVALVVVAILVGLFGFRREIVRTWPAAAAVYASLGIPTTPRPHTAPRPSPTPPPSPAA